MVQTLSLTPSAETRKAHNGGHNRGPEPLARTFAQNLCSEPFVDITTDNSILKANRTNPF